MLFMKKYLLLFILICFSILSISAQTKKDIKINSIRNELIDSITKLNKKIIAFERKLEVSDSINKAENEKRSKKDESIEKSIIDTRLRESLKSAESTINLQNSWIDGFGNIYTTITIVIAIIALLLTGMSILYFFFQVKPAVDEAKKNNKIVTRAIGNLKNRIEEFNKIIDSRLSIRFSEYSKTLKLESIDQIIIDLICQNSFLRDEAIYKLNTFKKSDLKENQLFKLLDILNKHTEMSLEEAIIYFFTKDDGTEKEQQIDNYLKHISNIKSENSFSYLIDYYLRNGITNYNDVIMDIILQSKEPLKLFTLAMERFYTETVADGDFLPYKLLVDSSKLSRNIDKKFIGELYMSAFEFLRSGKNLNEFERKLFDILESSILKELNEAKEK